MAVLWTPDFSPQLDFPVCEGDPLKHKASDYNSFNDEQNSILQGVFQDLDKGDHGIAKTLMESQIGRMRLLTVLAREAANTPELDRYESLLGRMTHSKLIGRLVVVSNTRSAYERINSVLPDRFESVFIEPGLFQVAVQRFLIEPNEDLKIVDRSAEIHLKTLRLVQSRSLSSVSQDFVYTQNMVDKIISGSDTESKKLIPLARQMGGLLSAPG